MDEPGDTSAGPSAADAADDAASSTVTRRANAFMIDLVLTFAVTALVSATAFITSSLELLSVILVVIPAIAVTVNTVSVWRVGHTLGQWLLGLSVVDAQTGSRMGSGRAIVRTLIIISPVLLSVAIGVLLALDGNGGSSPIGYVWFVTSVWFFMLVIASAFRTGALHDVATRSTVIHGQPRDN